MYSYFFNDIPKSSKKIIIPVSILTTYPRWINVTFHPSDLIEGGPGHILMLAVDMDDKTLNVYDSNGSFLLDKRTKLADKQYQDIVDCIMKAFQDEMGINLTCNFVPRSDLGKDLGDCAIYAVKAAVCEIEGKAFPKTFLSDTRKNFRVWLVGKCQKFEELVWKIDN